MTSATPSDRHALTHDAQIRAFQEELQRIRADQERQARSRRHRLILIGIAVSVVVHIGLVLYLASQYQLRPGRAASDPVTYEFAIVQEEELATLETTAFDDLVDEFQADLEMPETTSPDATLDPAIPASALEVAGDGALPALGGAGDGTGTGALSGGGAGTSFFGVASRGTRFAFIVDRSGSMGHARKMDFCLQELVNSIEELPDYASFYVLLFSDGFIEPPHQRDWLRATRDHKRRLRRWLNAVAPGGGTAPQSAIHQVFALPVRPDVVYFLTDGAIPEETVAIFAEHNRQGRRVTVHTIAFGDRSGEALLRQISEQSGGTYRPVETR